MFSLPPKSTRKVQVSQYVIDKFNELGPLNIKRLIRHKKLYPSKEIFWMRVRHVPASLVGYDLPKDKLEGTEEFGDPDDDTKCWAIKFNDLRLTLVKIES